MYKALLTAATAALASAIAPAMADGPPPPAATYITATVHACNPTTLQVYFQNGETVLSASARRAISSTADTLDGCALASVKLVSLSADGRTMPETTALAAGRLDIVSSALRDHGLVADDTLSSIDTDFDEAAVSRPMARRVEVQFAAYRPEIG